MLVYSSFTIPVAIESYSDMEYAVVERVAKNPIVTRLVVCISIIFLPKLELTFLNRTDDGRAQI